MKSKIVAYLLWVFGVFGCLGWHRFYLGKTKTGFIWLFTGGIAGVGSLIDLFSLSEQVNRVNRLFYLSKMASGEDVSKYGFIKPLNQIHSSPNSDIKLNCPYCKMTVPNLTQPRQKCPFCHKYIYLREQGIFSSYILKKEEAMAIDFLRGAASFGITENDYKHEEAQLAKYFMDEVSSSDIVFRLFKRLLESATDLNRQKSLQHSLDSFLREANLDYYTLVSRAIKLSLLKLKEEQYIKRVRIVTAGVTSCPACRSLEGQVFTIEEALNKMPIPCKHCSNLLAGKTKGFCRCEYRAEDQILITGQWNSSKYSSL